MSNEMLTFWCACSSAAIILLVWNAHIQYRIIINLNRTLIQAVEQEVKRQNGTDSQKEKE